MDRVASLNPAQRRELFLESSTELGMTPAVVEKDFWVCWVLNGIFGCRELKPHLVFKGGTSLAKVYGLIERFSEDVDFVLDWGVLGYGEGDEDPYRDFPSRTQRDRFRRDFDRRNSVYLGEELCPRLNGLMSSIPGVAAAVDIENSQSINVRYPASFPEDYVRPEVCLEIGPLASFVPRGEFEIQPYAAEVFPGEFARPRFSVVAIKAERTFWEKATILHQQAHRPGPIPPRYSRHYYDMFKLASSPIKDLALSAPDLLEDVVRHKIRFYECPWADYEAAAPGTFKLLPAPRHRSGLADDYRRMRRMIFGEVPAFDSILDALAALETEINGMTPSPA